MPDYPECTTVNVLRKKSFLMCSQAYSLTYLCENKTSRYDRHPYTHSRHTDQLLAAFQSNRLV